MLDKSKGSHSRSNELVARYARSNELLARARKVIPLGTQTFSKSYQQFPQGAAPLFLTHGKGSRVWDVDGNEYIDMIAGLLPVLLGYRDPDVDAAIKAQLDRGIAFSARDRARSRAGRAPGRHDPVRGDGALRQEWLGCDDRLRARRARGAPDASG